MRRGLLGIISSMETLLAAGTGVGLSSVAGIRAYLPLALVGLFARFGFFDLPAPFNLLENWLVVGALLVLALVESGLDKVPALDSILDIVQTPIRIVAGAILFAAALEAGLSTGAIPELAVGGAISGAVAVSKALLRPSANVATAGVSAPFLSGCEDVVALVGGIIAVLIPIVSLLLVLLLLFFFYRVRRRRGRKYGGLRILGD
jgi:hypothetical protein